MTRAATETAVPEIVEPRRGKLGAAPKLAWRVGVWSVLLVALALIIVAVVIPRIGGATPYTVLTGSMQPGLPPGTLVVVKPASADEIGIGSVITYQLKSGEPTVVTHRVVGVSSANGEAIFQTQGDANNAPDDPWVREVQVRGKLWYAVPGLGYVSSLLSVEQREAVKYIGAAALLAYAAFMFTGAIRDKARARNGKANLDDGPQLDAATEEAVGDAKPNA